MVRQSLHSAALITILLASLGARDATLPLEHEADWYSALDGGVVKCELCPRFCLIAPGRRGVCRVRQNDAGKLYSVVYGQPSAIGKEPIEKAPFFHFLPGATRITLATAGCNQSCKYCQNWELSQSSPEDLPTYDIPPDSVVKIALREQAPIICLTFSEPVVFYEYMCAIARLGRKAGLRTAVVTGGYINPEPLKELCSLVDAIKIDLKGFTPEFYRDVCGSTLEPVLDACRIVAESGTHLELVNLVVPTLNDDSSDIRDMCGWIRQDLGDTVPVHFTRFGPAYRMLNSPPTPVATLERAARIARRAGLKYVYIGNVPGHELESTVCPECGAVVLVRKGFTVTENNLEQGTCGSCGARIHGIWL
jgi:pyruvate formate lyase activating enzyme